MINISNCRPEQCGCPLVGSLFGAILPHSPGLSVCVHVRVYVFCFCFYTAIEGSCVCAAEAVLFSFPITRADCFGIQCAGLLRTLYFVAALMGIESNTCEIKAKNRYFPERVSAIFLPPSCVEWP